MILTIYRVLFEARISTSRTMIKGSRQRERKGEKERKSEREKGEKREREDTDLEAGTRWTDPFLVADVAASC